MTVFTNVSSKFISQPGSSAYYLSQFFVCFVFFDCTTWHPELS